MGERSAALPITASGPSVEAGFEPMSSARTTRCASSIGRLSSTWRTSRSRSALTHTTYARWSSRRYAVNLPEKWSEDFAHYLGWLVGDGCLTETSAVTVYGSTDEQQTTMLEHRRLLHRDQRGRGAKANANGKRHLPTPSWAQGLHRFSRSPRDHQVQSPREARTLVASSRRPRRSSLRSYAASMTQTAASTTAPRIDTSVSRVPRSG